MHFCKLIWESENQLGPTLQAVDKRIWILPLCTFVRQTYDLGQEMVRQVSRSVA